MRSPWVAVDAATIPAQHARELRANWEQFVDGGMPDADDPGSPPIRAPIVDSWLRSRAAGVDPSGRHPAPSVLGRAGARTRWETHPLADVALVIRQCTTDAAADADQLLVVSDASGMLLSIHGNPRLRSRAADDMNFVEGALWSESGAGTNAVGTALAADHAVQVFASEHFSEPVQRWTCAAAPVSDPETGDRLGVIDLTGPVSSAHPLSLSVVIATARAIEELLRSRLRERDDRLRFRYGPLLGPEPAGAALVTGAGRVLLDPRRLWSPSDVATIPTGGGDLRLPSGAGAVAEPVDSDDLYIVRPRPPKRRGSRPDAETHDARPRLELRLLGDQPGRVWWDGAALQLRPRHVELVALLALRRGRVNAEVLCTELYGDGGHPASIRVEMSRLRRLLPGAVEPEGYRLTCEIHSDVARVRALLADNAVAEAAVAYPGPLLPESSAPALVDAREELDGWLRHAVVTSEDARALWAWVQSPSGESDLMAWKRLLTAIDYKDARRSLAVARLAALRRLFAL